MFLTKDDLKLSYGVDLQIAELYVNRQVPVNNLYWKDRKIYLPAAPGYIFMPIFTDLLARAGVDKSILLSETQLILQEKILHAAAMLEYNMVSWQEHIQMISNIAAEITVDQQLFNSLNTYLPNAQNVEVEGVSLGTAFPSLKRADAYLYTLVGLDPSGYDRTKAIQGWYALMTYFLILDDLADIKEDLKRGEENILSDVGVGQKGIEKISAMLKESMHTMMMINPVMGNRIDHKMNVIDLPAIVRSITSSQ